MIVFIKKQFYYILNEHHAHFEHCESVELIDLILNLLYHYDCCDHINSDILMPDYVLYMCTSCYYINLYRLWS